MAERSVVYRVRADIGDLQTKMAAAGKSVGDAANKMTAATKEGQRFRKGLDQLGGAAGKVGLVAAGGLGAAVAASANFEQAMSHVRAATHESAANMDRLREAAIQAGADTAFSASEAAAGIENLAKAGVATQDILAGGLQGALDLAAAGSIGVAEAAEQAAKAMTQFGLSGTDVPHIADLLSAAAGKASGEVSDFGYALSQAGLVANQVGLSIEETTGGLAAFASAGLLGSDAGTSFKSALAALTPNSDAASTAMEQLGISAFDAQGNFIGLAEFAGVLQTSMRDLTDEQRQAKMEVIFGSDAVRAASVLYEQGEQGIREWTDAVNDQGFAAETAATKLDNLAGDLEAFKGSLETALIGAGEGSQAPLRSLVQGATDAVNVFNDLSPAAQGTATKLLAITAITGGGLWFGSKVIQGVTNTRAALDDLGLSAGRVARTAGGLMAVGLAITAISEASDALFDTRIDESDLARNLEALARGEITDNLGRLGDDLAILGSTVNRTAEPLHELGTAFGLFADTQMDKSAQNIEKVDEALAGLVEAGETDKAARIFEEIVRQAEASGVSVGEARDAFDSYATALANAENSTTFITNAFDAATGAIDLLAASADGGASPAIQRLEEVSKEAQEALDNARVAATETATGFFGLGEKVNKAKVSLGGWIRDLQKQAEALRDFRINAEEAAKRGLDDGLIAALREAGPEGALRLRQLADASDEQIDRANRAWRRGQREIERYVDTVVEVPPEVTTEVVVKAEAAMSTLYRLREFQIGDKTIAVHTVRTGGGEADYLSGGVRRAEGGPVYGPGTATSDSIPALLSNGEYVIRASAVERYGRHTFDALNAERYASGGLVGASAAPIGAQIDYHRLASALAAIRPPGQLYGDVTVLAHNYGDFQRQMMADRQAAGIGGIR